MSANKAIAEAVRLANPNVIPVYPITPQTTNFRVFGQICRRW